MADWSLIAVRLALYVVLSAMFGLAAFSLYGLTMRERGDALTLRPWLIASACLGLILSIAWLILMATSMAGTSLWPIDQEALGALLTGSAIGTAWKVRMVALVVATACAGASPNRTLPLILVTASGAVGLGSLAWTGHGAMDEGSIGWAHLVADIFHLLASGTWVGALVGLLLLVSRPVVRVDASHLRLTHRALHGFGSIGTIVVGTIVISGLVNGWVLVGLGNITTLTSNLYGQLFVLKLVLFAAILGLASLNRFRLTPAFEQSIAAENHRGALGALRTSLLVETGCVVGILGLVAWLGTLSPSASAM
ncbi:MULTISPECIES: copper homeostasis membrane protein CopD [Sphingomonas]|uniref:copper homeostasis membrane protein CopD n=1 Tax=Sphingomonas TaxID=13687 RepID=UPI000DEF13D7|nr:MULTISPECIES: copper homeostasis membrane protein CopD [Sphingomonas]